MRHLQFTASQTFSSGARLTPVPVGRVTPCAPSWRTKTPPLAGIARVNQRVLVSRRRAEDCPPYLGALPLPEILNPLTMPTRFTSPSRQKTPVIVLHQASSRHPMKINTAIPSANGAAPYQPRAKPWVCPPHDASPVGASHPANQGTIKA